MNSGPLGKILIAATVIGMTIGSYVPSLWGAGVFTVGSVIWSGIGGALFLWGAYAIFKNWV